MADCIYRKRFDACEKECDEPLGRGPLSHNTRRRMEATAKIPMDRRRRSTSRMRRFGTLRAGEFWVMGRSIYSVALIFLVLQLRPVFATLIVAVPVSEGLVACSDRRLYNDVTLRFEDNTVKIHKIDRNTLFVVTNTVGFLNKASGKLEFDVNGITAAYAAKRSFNEGPAFLNGLRGEIRKRLLAYLATQKYENWPETDIANNKLLFNLVFYSAVGHSIKSYSLTVFYEKAKTPIIFIPNVVTETVKTPQLIGKGKMVIDYLSRNPEQANDPAILRFDQSNFNVNKTSIVDAVSFAQKLFLLTNTALPQSEVSAAYDCALLAYENGFEWIDDRGSVKR